MAKPSTIKEGLQTDLNRILTSVEGKLNAEATKKIKQAMDNLLEQDNQFNRDVLVTAVDELLIIGDSKELHKTEIKKIIQFLESLKEFLGTGLKELYEYRNFLAEEQRKINTKIQDIQETHRLRFSGK